MLVVDYVFQGYFEELVKVKETVKGVEMFARLT